MLHVRLAYTLQTLFRDEQRDPREPRPHILGQGLDLRVNGLVQGLDRPVHISVYQKRYILKSCFFKGRSTPSEKGPPQASFSPARSRADRGGLSLPSISLTLRLQRESVPNRRREPRRRLHKR